MHQHASPAGDRRNGTLAAMTSAHTAAATADSVLSPHYRATTLGMVALVSLIAFEALAVAAAMPTVARELGPVNTNGLSE